MKKLLIATDTFLPRIEGVTRFLLNMIPRLERDYEVKVIAPDFNKVESTEKIVRLPCFKFQVADLIPAKFNFMKIRKHIKDSDIIFVQSIAPIGAVSILWGWLMRKKIVAYIHVIEWELVTKAISRKFLKRIIDFSVKVSARWLYNRCDLLIVPSANIVELLNRNRIKSKKIVVHMGIDTTKFTPAKNKAQSKIQLNIKPDKKVIGYVGRLAREKDLKTLLRGFSRARKKYPNTVLLIVGDGIEEVKNIFKNKKGVMMAGKVSNVVPYLQAMDIFVLSSLTETSSLATMEAMACETAVIVTPVGYVKDYVVEGFNGLFFPKKDAYALAKKIEKLIEDSSLRNKIAANARKTIVKYFSWDDTSKKIKRALEKL